MRVIAFHVQHDANVAVVEDGVPVLVLELERLFEVRYFECARDLDEFRAQWRRALDEVARLVGRAPFDLGVTSWVMPSQRRALAELVDARAWVTAHHHHAHAATGFYDAPFDRALVLSFDGGGSDGTFSIFRGDRRTGIERLERIPLNLGTPYRLLGVTMPEVTGGKPQPRAGHLALAGKLMAYAALGQPRPEWGAALRDYYRHFQEPRQALYSLGIELDLPLEADALEPRLARDLAATSQFVFEELALEALEPRLRSGEADGLVVTGGCALNVVFNERLRSCSPLPVHVPPAPNDAGIALGAAWLHDPPAADRAPRGTSPFLGPPLARDVPDAELARRGAREIGPRELARVLANGAVVGVARGRCELGPRALGHRSILCDPRRDDMRARINARIKRRESFRPFAPVVPADRSHDVCPGLTSPYMSFAIQWPARVAERLPAVTHADGTARVQTLERDTEPFLHAVLSEFERLTGTPVLLNTSLNTLGGPLVQRASAALSLLDETELDFLLLEDQLVPGDEAAWARFS